MKITAKQITFTAVLLAICIVSQFFKNTSVYITGPIINAAIILAVLYCGMTCSFILCVIAPITSYIITGSPIMAAIPAMIPCVMLGNAALTAAVGLLKDKLGKKAGLPISIVIGAVMKAILMGVLISLILLPNFLPEAMQPKLTALQAQFSVVQLTTALIGGVYALIIHAALKKAGFFQPGLTREK